MWAVNIALAVLVAGTAPGTCSGKFLNGKAESIFANIILRRKVMQSSHTVSFSWIYWNSGLCSTRIFRADLTLIHVTIRVIQL